MSVLAILGVVVFIAVLLLGAFMTLLGLPGTLVILIDAVIFSAVTGWERLPWGVLLVLTGITLVAEISDNLISAAGVKKYGGTTAGMIWAIIGGLVGAIGLGSTLGAIIPVVGPIVAPIAGGLLGGFFGGYWYEKSQGRTDEEAKKAGMGAVMGRIAGSLLKAVLAATMIVIILTNAF